MPLCISLVTIIKPFFLSLCFLSIITIKFFSMYFLSVYPTMHIFGQYYKTFFSLSLSSLYYYYKTFFLCNVSLSIPLCTTLVNIINFFSLSIIIIKLFSMYFLSVYPIMHNFGQYYKTFFSLFVITIKLFSM